VPLGSAKPYTVTDLERSPDPISGPGFVAVDVMSRAAATSWRW
jgi:hypothetical protein